RMVQTAAGGLFPSVVVAAGWLYWMLTVPDPAGRVAVGSWSARFDGGPATLVAADVGLPLLPGPGYDMQVHADRLYWTTLPPAEQSTGPPHGRRSCARYRWPAGRSRP